MSETNDDGITKVREGFEFDVKALGHWMEDHVEGFDGPISVSQFSGGQSNPTFKIVTPARSYVLRRKPMGDLLKGAHAVDREARVMTALDQAGLPVPKVYGLCTDDSVIGSWFFIMEMIEGRVFWDGRFPDVARGTRPAYFFAMNEFLARLHTLDYRALGLEDYGKPGNYFERQISRWSRQYLQDEGAGRDPNMDRLAEWLPANVPTDDGASSLVHGDYRCDNMIFHPTKPQVLAVLDWELSTLGHPLADFTYNSMTYRLPPHILGGIAGTNLAAMNIPSETEYINAYCRNTGRDGIENYRFYMAFNMFRLAAIFHGIKGRAIRGTASSSEAIERVKVLPELAEIGWRQATGG